MSRLASLWGSGTSVQGSTSGASSMTGKPWVNHTNRVFKNTPNGDQALSAQRAAVKVEGLLPGGEWAPPRHRDIRRDLTNESPRVRRTSSSWRSGESSGEERSRTVGGSMDVRAAAQRKSSRASSWLAVRLSPFPSTESAPKIWR